MNAAPGSTPGMPAFGTPGRGVIAAILALALALRGAAAWLIPDQGALLADIGAYRASAMALLTHGHPGDPFQMPLYPALIAMTGPGRGQLIADILLSVLMVWLVAAIAQEIFRDRLATIFAALATACYPPLIFFAVVGLSETLFITLMLAAFLSWYRASFTLAAVFAVLAILTRPVLDLLAPAMIVLFALVVHRMTWRQTLLRLLSYAAIYAVLMTPWWFANYQAYGEFVRLTAGSGTALYAGNNPLNKSGGGNVGEDYDLKDFRHIENLLARDRALRESAIRYIADHPARFVEGAWLKFARMWRPWPANAGYSNLSTVVLSALSFLPVLVLAIAGLVLKRHRIRVLSPVLAFMVAYTGIHMILVGTIRYRLPLEPFLLILGAAAAAEIARKAMPRQATQAPVTR